MKNENRVYEFAKTSGYYVHENNIRERDSPLKTFAFTSHVVLVQAQHQSHNQWYLVTEKWCFGS